MVEIHQPLRVWIRQPAQHDTVYHREDRGGRPDAQCEDPDDRDGEPWLPRKGADGKAKILRQLFQHIRPTSFWHPRSTGPGAAAAPPVLQSPPHDLSDGPPPHGQRSPQPLRGARIAV